MSCKFCSPSEFVIKILDGVCVEELLAVDTCCITGAVAYSIVTVC